MSPFYVFSMEVDCCLSCCSSSSSVNRCWSRGEVCVTSSNALSGRGHPSTHGQPRSALSSPLVQVVPESGMHRRCW